MKSNVTKAIFPATGLGTRFLPTTKSIPKEIITLVDRTLIQYALDEARAVGIKQFIFITLRGKNALEDYVDRGPQLELELRKKGKDDLLETLDHQHEKRRHRLCLPAQGDGLSHAVWCARNLFANEPFAVILHDDFVAADTPSLQQMVDVHAETSGNMVAAIGVLEARTSSYGILDCAGRDGRLVDVKGMVQKPETGIEPSNIAVMGRYVLAPNVLRNPNRIKRSPTARCS